MPLWKQMIDNDIYSTVDACPNACEIWKAIERLKQGSRAEGSYHKFYDILKQHQNEANEIRAEKLARTQVVQNSRIECYNFKEYGHVSRECQNPKWNAEQADSKDDTNVEPGDQELEAHYMYMAPIQEVTPDAADNSGPIFVAEPLLKVQNDDDKYNVFDNDREHPEQPESVNDHIRLNKMNII
nr:hypothetical protein [Tanacetum cinerariifolium]